MNNKKHAASIRRTLERPRRDMPDIRAEVRVEATRLARRSKKSARTARAKKRKVAATGANGGAQQ